MRSLILLLLNLSCSVAIACQSIDWQKQRLQTQTEFACFFDTVRKKQIRYAVTFPVGFPFTEKTPYAIYLHGRGGGGRQFKSFGEQIFKRFTTNTNKAFVVIAPAEPQHSYWKNGMNNSYQTEDLLIHGLIPHIESQAKNVLQSKKVIFGISMGGHGAMMLAQKYPEKFQAFYSISPVFHQEDQLLSEDHLAFGYGEYFQSNDPVSIFKNADNRFPLQNFRVEIGAQDPLLDQYPLTQNFLVELNSIYGDETINIKRSGSHNLDYWRPALKRAFHYFSTIF